MLSNQSKRKQKAKKRTYQYSSLFLLYIPAQAMSLMVYFVVFLLLDVVGGQGDSPPVPQSGEWGIHVAYTTDSTLPQSQTTEVVSEQEQQSNDGYWGIYVAYKAPDDLDKASSLSSVLPPSEVKVEDVPSNVPQQCQQTVNKCKCKVSWTFGTGGDVSTYSGCANPDNDLYSSWCILEESEDCVFEAPPLGRIQSSSGVPGAWFDRCLPDCPDGSGLTPSNDWCFRTISGCTCKESWQFEGASQSGCNNPDGDSLGAWCEIVRGSCEKGQNVKGGQFQNDATGEIVGEWDYCLKECDGPGKEHFGISSK
eukprot:TRINITY_DN1358_c0_g1_i3.p2 TRINITY_DN1358_c0_g1~~TRINITY_DN1358_c0_g1_i3.p2  ORF type:complete len:327 (+),score=47.46 TRINITY_DN1358_c0_g1_i3:55-981(+)